MQLYFSPKYLVYFFTFCIFHFTSIGFAQEQGKDSLDSFSYEELTQKFQKVRISDFVAAKAYITKALEIALDTDDAEKLFYAYRSLAKTENLTGNIEEALLQIDIAIEIAKQRLKDSEKAAECIFTKAYMSYNFGLYEEAFSNYTVAYNYYKNTDNKSKTNQISVSIALIKNILGDHDGAIQLLLKNYNNYLSLSEKGKKEAFGNDLQLNILMALSNAYTRKAIKNSSRKTVFLDSAYFYNTIGLKETQKMNNEIVEVHFIADRGVILQEKDSIHSALEALDISLEKNKKFKNPGLLTAIYYYKGMCYKKLNQIDKAITYLKKTDSITAKTSTNYIILQTVYYTLGEIYKERQDFANVVKYQNLYIENDRINERLTGTVREDIHEKYDLEVLNSEIDDLHKKSSLATIVISVLAVILLGFFVFYRFQKRKNKIAFQKLLEKLEAKKEEKASPTKPAKSIVIDDEKVVQVLKALERFEKKEWFRNKNCNLAFVAKKTKTNKTYVSKIIYEHKQLKFIDYIRNLRVDYALERLKDDPVFRSYDIKSIAEESGFKSSDMFSRAFVKNTGIYPSYYIKNINKINT
jgi:AraC-like DNA-binding protein